MNNHDYSNSTFVALDVDGVLNHFSKSAKRSASGTVGEFPIQWRPALLEELRELLSSPGVVGVWLTTWVAEPKALDELEELLGLKGLMELRVPWPYAEHPSGRPRTVTVEGFEGVLYGSRTPKWWKYRAVELLKETYKPKRMVWLDDEVGINVYPGHPGFLRGNTYEYALVKTDEKAGLLPEHMERLRSWLNMEDPS